MLGDRIPFNTIGFSQPKLFTYHLMFNMYITVPNRTSTAVKELEVDLLKQKARFTFKDGKGYEFSNVSKRAIANVLFNPDVSLGFWVNNNCINSERTYETSSTRDVAVRRLKRALAKSEGFEEVNLPNLPSFA